MITPQATPYWIKIFSGQTNQPLSSSSSVPQKEDDPVALFLGIKDYFWTQYQIAVQLFRPEYVLSLEHLALIIHHVDQAFHQGVNISTQKAMEFLLYLSGQRQISEAIVQVGIGKSSRNSKPPTEFGVVMFGSSTKLTQASEEIVKMFSNFSMEEFIPIPSLDLPKFINRVGISMTELMNIFFSYPGAESYPLVTPETILTVIPENFAHNVLLDALNRRMTALYLYNYKDAIKKFQD